MSAPTNATHWISGTVSGSLTTDRIRKLHGDRGIAAFMVSERDAASVSRNGITASGSFGARMYFEVVAIERTVDDDGRPSSSGAAIIYLREVSR
jgi:hypothetical protein